MPRVFVSKKSKGDSLAAHAGEISLLDYALYALQTSELTEPVIELAVNYLEEYGAEKATDLLMEAYLIYIPSEKYESVLEMIDMWIKEAGGVAERHIWSLSRAVSVVGDREAERLIRSAIHAQKSEGRRAYKGMDEEEIEELSAAEDLFEFTIYILEPTYSGFAENYLYHAMGLIRKLGGKEAVKLLDERAEKIRGK